jgi:hypothetical protein
MKTQIGWVEEMGRQLGEAEHGLATRYEPKVDVPPFRRGAAETAASSKRGAESAQSKRASKALAGLGGS